MSSRSTNALQTGRAKRRDNIFEPAHDKTYNKTFATSEDLDQPALPRSLIRAFADRMCRLQPPGYPKMNEREPLPYWVDVQADLSLCWSHRSYCRFCRALTLLFMSLCRSTAQSDRSFMIYE